MAQEVGAKLLPAGGEIAFSLARTSGRQIYAMDVNRRLSVRLTKDSSNNSFPVWSPDGSKILFVTDRTNNAEIYVMNADGSGVLNLTKHQATDASPAWSPDSQTIAFLSQREGEIRVYIVHPDGSGLRMLSDQTAYSLAWSPDGTKLAFAALYSYHLYDVVTGRIEEIRGNFLSMGQMLWLPNTEQMVFTSSRPGRAAGAGLLTGVLLVNADGSQLRRFFDIGANESALTFSPDGKQLVMLADCLSRGCETIYVVNADGSNARQLPYLCTSSGRVALFNPTWSSDSQWIAFVSKCGEGYDVYMMRQDGSDLQRLTTFHSSDNLFPAWRP
jgi:Tol biopolymer transport system component